MVAPSEGFERQFYQQARYAFYHRFVERVERKSSQSSLYGVIRQLSKRSIELDMAGSLSDLAVVLSESAQPFVTSLRKREVLTELSSFLATISDEFQCTLGRLDQLGRLAADDLIDHRFGGTTSPLNSSAIPTLQRIWPGIGVSFGTAVEPWKILGKVPTETEIILQQFNHAFLEFVGAYDRLWLPFFDFLERYFADKCHLLWKILATYSLDFRRYSAYILEAKTEANKDYLDKALVAARRAHAIKPHEYMPRLFEGYLLYQRGSYEEAIELLEQIVPESLPFVCLKVERLFWLGRCHFELGLFEEAIVAFEGVAAKPKDQIEVRYFCEAKFLLAFAYLLLQKFEQGSLRLIEAILDGYTDVEAMISDPRLVGALANPTFRSTLRSVDFLQALSRQAGIQPFGSTYLSRSAAVDLATAEDGWLELEDVEDVVFFFDASRNGSGRYGFCLTNSRLVWKESAKPSQDLPFESLRSWELESEGLNVNDGLLISDHVFDRLESLDCLLYQIQKIFER